MAKERNKLRFSIYGSLLVAILTGIYAQDMAYFLYHYLTIPLLKGLGMTTVLSLVLFFLPPILVSKLEKREVLGKREYRTYFSINILLGVIVSTFSLIVLVAWCG